MSKHIRCFSGWCARRRRTIPPPRRSSMPIVKRNPDSAPARNNLAQVYLAAGRVEDAKKTYQDFLSRKPDDPTALLALVRYRGAREEMGRGDRVCREGTRGGAEGSGAWHQAVEHLWGTPGLDAREGAGQRIGDAVPGNAAVAEAQGRILAAAGDRDAAVEPFRQAYEAAPNSEPIFQRYLGALVAAKRLPEARTVAANAAR